MLKYSKIQNKTKPAGTAFASTEILSEGAVLQGCHFPSWSPGPEPSSAGLLTQLTQLASDSPFFAGIRVFLSLQGQRCAKYWLVGGGEAHPVGPQPLLPPSALTPAPFLPRISCGYFLHFQTCWFCFPFRTSSVNLCIETNWPACQCSALVWLFPSTQRVLAFVCLQIFFWDFWKSSSAVTFSGNPSLTFPATLGQLTPGLHSWVQNCIQSMVCLIGRSTVPGAKWAFVPVILCIFKSFITQQ